MPRSLSRRQALARMGSAALLSATGCRSSAPGTGAFAGRELKVFVYAGGHEKTMREVFAPRFEAATGAAVSLYPGWWDGIVKLKAAPAGEPPFDLMISDATQGYPAAREGLFAQLNLANIPSHREIVPAALDNWLFRDRYGVTYPDSVMTFAYNRTAVTAPPQSWGDLLRPDLAGKVGLYSSFYMTLYTFACVQAAVEGRPGTAHERIEKQLPDVLRFARAHREAVKLWWPTSTDMILSLVNKECLAGNMHSPEYIQAMREKPELAALIPESDRAFVQVFWAVPAGSKNQDLAERAIDLIFSEEMQLEFARRGSAAARPDAAAKMAAEDTFWKQLYPHRAEDFAKLRYYPYDVYAGQWDRLADEWDRTVLRKG